MRSFNQYLESLTPMAGAAPPYTELRGVAWSYDEQGVHEGTNAGTVTNPDLEKITGRYDPEAQTLAIIVPRRLSGRYHDDAIKQYIETVVLPALRKKYEFRRHFIYT